MNQLKNCINRARNWWSNKHNAIIPNLVRGINRIVRNITRLIVIGIILNIIANHFYPDFPARFPIIYGWFDGWVQFGEFALKAGLASIYALFSGNWPEFWTEYTDAFHSLWQQFINWLSSLHF